MLVGTNRYVDNYQYLTFKRNYHFENVRYIQLDFAFDRIYITFFYEDYKQQTYMADTHEKKYLDEMIEKETKKSENSKHKISITIDGKELFSSII